MSGSDLVIVVMLIVPKTQYATAQMMIVGAVGVKLVNI